MKTLDYTPLLLHSCTCTICVLHITNQNTRLPTADHEQGKPAHMIRLMLRIRYKIVLARNAFALRLLPYPTELFACRERTQKCKCSCSHKQPETCTNWYLAVITCSMYHMCCTYDYTQLLESSQGCMSPLGVPCCMSVKTLPQSKNGVRACPSKVYVVLGTPLRAAFLTPSELPNPSLY